LRVFFCKQKKTSKQTEKISLADGTNIQVSGSILIGSMNSFFSHRK